MDLCDRAGELRALPEVRRQIVDEAERIYLKELLRRADDNLARAAELAGLTRQAISHLVHKHGLRSRNS
jgi:two-component system NtrC family response regulator